MSCAYFVSDLHLVAPDEEKSEVFLRFLQNMELATARGSSERPTHLFLVGDIFDLWVGSHEYFRERFKPIVNAIRRLVEAGVSVHFFEGNHDLHLEEFWGKNIGVIVHTGAMYFEVAGRTIRVEHGDLINPNDRGYLFLRKFLRTSVMKSVALNLPSGAINWIGERASRASRVYTSTAKELPREKIRALIRDHAERAFMERGFDLIVTGHVHVLDDIIFAASGRQVRSINLGSWFDKKRAFVLSETRAEFVTL